MTGWTWEHVTQYVTLPQVHALQTHWQYQPPMVVLAARLCRHFGVEAGKTVQPTARSPEEAMREAMMAGLPIAHGRPDDPDLQFLGL